MLLSALEGEGLDQLWSSIEQHRATLTKSGALQAKRSDQQRRWLWQILQAGLEERLRLGLKDELAALEAAVAAGETTPGHAAEELLARLFGSRA